MTNISIVIPSYNAQDNLAITLAALGSQAFSGRFDVIVVDCSESDAVEKICAGFDFARCHREPERFNPGIGRNLGAERADGELLIFVDADVVLQDDALEQAWSFYRSGHKIFGGALELNEAKTVGVASYLEHYFFNHESQRGRPERPRANLSSALMAFQRALFLKKGRFKDIPRMQDTELTERMVSQGYELGFNPRFVGLQTQDSPMRKVLGKIMINGRNLYFIRYRDRSVAFKALIAALLPFVALAKVGRIILRHLLYQKTPRGKLITVGLIPLLIGAGGYWMLGFYRSLIGREEMSTRRD